MTTYENEIRFLLAQDRDLRWFDASAEGLANATTAGESIRFANARRERAEALPETVSKAVRDAIELALPNMPARDQLYTMQALRRCPRR